MSIIVVIDDGISKLTIPDLEFNLSIDENLRISNCKTIVKSNSHGTMCAQIIRKYAPTAKIGSIKILDSITKTGFVNKLTSAIDWCIEQGFSLINLSLGSTYSVDYFPLKKCINNAYKHKILIIAAISNKNVVSYPASFTEVIGVMTDPLLTDDMYYMSLPNIEGVDVYASSRHNINPGTQICNSYAVPLITSIIHNSIYQIGQTSLNVLKKQLNEYSFKRLINYYPNKKYNLDDILVYRDIQREIKIEIPSIAILRGTNGYDRNIYKLNDLFLQNGYNTVLFSTKYRKNPHFNIVSPIRLVDENIAFISNRYEADLIIVEIFPNDIEVNSNFSCDILFEENNFINYENKITYEKKIIIYGNDYHKIYDLSINLLS